MSVLLLLSGGGRCLFYCYCQEVRGVCSIATVRRWEVSVLLLLSGGERCLFYCYCQEVGGVCSIATVRR